MKIVEPKLIVITAPSGAGKTTIVKHLLKDRPRLAFSVSATTRDKRGNEIDGKDYYFLSRENFMNRIENDEFIEWEEVYNGTMYGTLKSEVQRLWDHGRHVVFDIDVQGALALKKLYGARALTIFIKPPNHNALVHRLRNRSTESEEFLQTRIEKAHHELTYENRFDVVIVNDTLAHALEEAERVVDKFTNN